MTATKDTVPITHMELSDLREFEDNADRDKIYQAVIERHDAMYSRGGTYFQVQRRVGATGVYIGVGDHEHFGSAHE